MKPAGVLANIVSYSQHRGPFVSLSVLRVQPNLPAFMPDGVYSACWDIAVITRVHKDEAPTFFVLKFFLAELLKCAVSELLLRIGDTDCSPWSRMDLVAQAIAAIQACGK